MVVFLQSIFYNYIVCDWQMSVSGSFIMTHGLSYSYGPSPVLSTFNHIYNMYNPTEITSYNQEMAITVHILPTENCTVAICQLGTSNQGFLAGFPWDFHAGTQLQAHGRSAGGTAGDLIHVSLKNTATSVEIMICL